MSFEQNFIVQQNVETIAQGIKDSCNPNEINHCIRKYFTVTKKFEGAVDTDKVTKIKETMTPAVAASLYVYLQRQSLVPTLNKFNASSYIKPTYDAFSVGDNTLNFFSKDSATTVRCASGVIGNFSPFSSVINTAAMTVPSHISRTPTFAAVNPSALSTAAREQLSNTFRGILLDDSPESRLCALKKFLATTGDIKAKIFEQWLVHVPLVGNKRIIDFKFDQLSGSFSDISVQDYAFQNFSFVEKYDDLVKRIDTHTSGCGNRRFLIHAIDSWVGCPIRSPWLADVIALYEAGVKHGDSIFIDTKDKARVTLLRHTFGERVYGCGSEGFMITKVEARLRPYTWVYCPELIKMVNGEFKDSYKPIYKHYLEVVDSVKGISGRRILHITPLLCYSSQFWDSFVRSEIKRPNRVKLWEISARLVQNYNGVRLKDAEALPNPMQVIEDANEFTCLRPEEVDFLGAHFFIDPFCSEGTVGIVLDSHCDNPVSEAIGNMLVYSKRMHLALYFFSAIQKNTYKVFLGKHIGIQYDDDYSMAFSEGAKLIFDSEEMGRAEHSSLSAISGVGNSTTTTTTSSALPPGTTKIQYSGEDEEPS